MSYVRNAWYVAAWSHEIEPAKPFAISILDEPVVIYRGESGRLAALEDRCVHRMAPLSLGRCEGERLRWADVAYDAADPAVKFRREMEAAFGRRNTPA